MTIILLPREINTSPERLNVLRRWRKWVSVNEFAF